MNCADIVDDYIQRYRNAARKEMDDFKNERSLSAAIRRAALCELRNGKRHPHQRRIPKEVLERVGVRLQAIEQRLAKATNFAIIHKLVGNEIGNLYGIGPLTVYDVAHRIGAYLEKAPERVYLHAGTKIGARVLGIKGDSFDPGSLPKSLSLLSPAEIEDCLCIYKDELEGAQ